MHAALCVFDGMQHLSRHRIGAEGGAAFQPFYISKLIDSLECGEVVVFENVDGLGDGVVHIGLQGRLHIQVRLRKSNQKEIVTAIFGFIRSGMQSNTCLASSNIIAELPLDLWLR